MEFKEFRAHIKKNPVPEASEVLQRLEQLEKQSKQLQSIQEAMYEHAADGDAMLDVIIPLAGVEL